MNQHEITIKDIEPLVPFSRGSTEIFLTGYWSGRRPVWAEKTSPCRGACPIGNDIARAFYHASKGDYDEALRVFRQENPLPGVCGRVCYHPCEFDCNRKPFDEAINIRGFERFLADHGKVDIKKDAPNRSRKEAIAVIGSGPAGLAASYHLARLGYPVTVFETLPEPGGMLRYGIPEYRLPKAILRREISYIRQLGVEIKTGVRVGKDISLSRMKKDYQAVFVALGAHGGMRLGIEGDPSGVIEGIGFLRRINSGEKINPGERIAVIGGGNTAVDCARSARRLGGKDVTIIYRRSRAEMPALAEDVASVEREGIAIRFLAAPARVIFRNGRVSGLECIRMELGAPDAGGRPEPLPVKGSEFIVPADTVIAAVGQVPEADFVGEAGLSVNRRGMIEVLPGTAATSAEGVFAGGDSAGARAFVADAIASGKMGAFAIACYLQGKDVKKEFEDHRIGTGPSFSFRHFVDPENNPADLKDMVTFDKLNTVCSPYGARNNNHDRLKVDESIRGFKEVSGGVRPGRMEAEIGRCFKCGTCTRCDLCFLLCPDISITKAGNEGYEVRQNYCKGCGMCAATCPRNVIDIGEKNHEEGGGR
jgi:NADPH-dependent glutamate synthase beta subunit-like oxidoreductase/Pyruvate/2-oxoacid:ferredoxin oxidoreductase delta subunit